MKAVIAWWDLSQSKSTVDSLREHLQGEGADVWESVQGLILKYWISDANNNFWGAIMIWESENHMKQSLPANRALELIGYPPTVRFAFDIEAYVSGYCSRNILSELGLVLEKNE